MKIVLREFNGYQIRQREDGYINLTDMATATGKLTKDWFRMDSTNELISVISHNEGISPDILVTRKPYYGTWGHKKVAIAFATWCSPEFFSVVIDWTQEILTKGYVVADHSAETIERLEAELSEIKTRNNTLTRLVVSGTVDTFVVSLIKYMHSKEDEGELDFHVVFNEKIVKRYYKYLSNNGIKVTSNGDSANAQGNLFIKLRNHDQKWIPRSLAEYFEHESHAPKSNPIYKSSMKKQFDFLNRLYQL